MTKRKLSLIGLVSITFLSAIQYGFIRNIPDTVLTFSFLFMTNLVGFILLAVLQFPKLISMRKETLIRGSILAFELTGYNAFLLLGSKATDSIMIASISSIYFIFVTPLLIILGKKVSFFSHIASIIAVISLILMFHADISLLLRSENVLYLIVSDLFFALYVVSVSYFCKNEDSVQLTLAQILFSVIFSLAGWLMEMGFTHSSMSFPTQINFWVCVIFVGVFIRVIYTLVQISCQKNIPVLNASLIISAEIFVTLLIHPVMCKLFHMEYTSMTVFQYVGCIFFVIAILLLDNKFMDRIGFRDVDLNVEFDENGGKVIRSSIARKIIMLTVNVSMAALIISGLVGVCSIYVIRQSVVDNFTSLGSKTSKTSEKYLTDQLEKQLLTTVNDKADFADMQLYYYSDAVNTAASYAESLYADPDHYPEKEVSRPKKEKSGKWSMYYLLANENISYDDVKEESKLLGNMFDVFKPAIKNNADLVSIYFASESGIMVCYDQNIHKADNKKENYYEYRKSNWYKLAKRRIGNAFTEPYEDNFGKGLTVSNVTPVYNKNGKFVGCVCVDILVDNLNTSMVSEGINESDSATLIDSTGNIIAGEGMNAKSSEAANIFDSDSESNLKDYGKEILEEKNGMIKTEMDDEDTYIVYATVDITGWTLVISSPVSSVLEPVVITRGQIDEDTDQVLRSVEDIILEVVQIILILIAVLLLITLMMAGKISERISLPLKQLECDVNKISSGDFTQRTLIQTDDEIGQLAKTFNFMSESLEKYIEDMKEVTEREQKAASEMALAKKIQADMLPRVFPAFPDRDDFDLYATMAPAKEVGGDFYDYFLLDEDHIVLVMADVSGKGVPAALFMVSAKTMIKNRAFMGGSPSEILAYVNDQLCAGNEAEMFVTVWFAMIELSTGKVTTVNAGHEYPVIKRKDGEFEIIKTRHSMALAAMEGLNYRENEFEIYPGDRIYIYTDGVPEATNASDEMYGVDRMLESLNKRKDLSKEEILYGIKEDIDSFVGDAPQFDDITMLIFDYLKSAD